MVSKQQILHQVFGYSEFRPGQEALIDAQLSGRDVLGIMPTGGGKSLCYQLPALLHRGVTLVVSPLISLMQDQVMALKNAGVPGAYINSSLTGDQIRTVYRRVREGMYKIIYIAPERLLLEGFVSAVSMLEISMVVVDEAHCISQWGQDFRPSYLRIPEFLAQLPYRPVVSAFTATATEQVRGDIEKLLQLRSPLRQITGFDRPNLYFEVRRPQNKAAELLSLIRERAGKTGIVYCSTRRETESICALLQQQGIRASRYHAGLSDEERRANQEDFVYDRCTVMAATNAFGMGIDKSNVSFVIHYNMPQSLEQYYQEAGRAGRDGARAECILLFAPGDVQTAKFLIQNSGEQDTDENPVLRARQLQLDLERLDVMVEYCRTDKCLRSFILQYFGEESREDCGNCGNCGGDFEQRDITGEAQKILSGFLQVENFLGYSLGKTAVIQMLRGSREKRVLELHLDSLPTYGVLKTASQKELRAMMESLENSGCLRTDITTGAVRTTPKAAEVLQEEARVTMRVRIQKTEAVPEKPRPTTSEGDPGLYEVLRSLRTAIAAKERVPAYIVFSNATLQDMAKKQPHTKEAFLEVSGVGAAKAERYAEPFLAAIRNYLEKA